MSAATRETKTPIRLCQFKNPVLGWLFNWCEIHSKPICRPVDVYLCRRIRCSEGPKVSRSRSQIDGLLIGRQIDRAILSANCYIKMIEAPIHVSSRSTAGTFSSTSFSLRKHSTMWSPHRTVRWSSGICLRPVQSTTGGSHCDRDPHRRPVAINNN